MTTLKQATKTTLKATKKLTKTILSKIYHKIENYASDKPTKTTKQPTQKQYGIYCPNCGTLKSRKYRLCYNCHQKELNKQ